jgi:hypothetical protein
LQRADAIAADGAQKAERIDAARARASRE